MKRSLLIFLLIVPMFFAAQASAPEGTDSLTAQATRAYSTGEYEQALALFDSVHTEYSSPALLYNIGNCYFKLNDMPHAILFYERALRLAPGDADVKANLELARQSVVDRVNELPAFNLGSTWGKIRGGKDADQWARRSIWACLLLFLVLTSAVVVRARNLRRVLFGLSGLLFFATLLSVSFAAFRNSEVKDDSEAIVMSAKVDVRSEPRTNTTVLFVLHKGTKVIVLKTENDWSEVQLANGSVGWMPPSTIERI